MTEPIITLLAVAFAAAAFLKTSRLLKGLGTLDDETRQLQDQFKSTRLRLKEKLDRLILWRKRRAGETIPTVTFQKLGKTVNILFPADTLFSIAEEEGFGLSGTCEGNGNCGLCVVSILSGSENISPMNTEEEALLKKLGYAKGSRLSCQPRIKGDVVVDFLELG